MEGNISKGVGYSLEDGRSALFSGLTYLKAVGRRCLTMEPRIQFQARFGVFRGQRGTDRGSSANTSFCPCHCHSSNAPFSHLLLCHRYCIVLATGRVAKYNISFTDFYAGSVLFNSDGVTVV